MHFGGNDFNNLQLDHESWLYCIPLDQYKSTNALYVVYLVTAYNYQFY